MVPDFALRSSSYIYTPAWLATNRPSLVPRPGPAQVLAMVDSMVLAMAMALQPHAEPPSFFPGLG